MEVSTAVEESINGGAVRARRRGDVLIRLAFAIMQDQTGRWELGEAVGELAVRSRVARLVVKRSRVARFLVVRLLGTRLENQRSLCCWGLAYLTF